MSGSPETESDQHQSRLLVALERILVALARILIKQKVSFPVFMDLAKRAFVKVATEEHGLRGRPASKSRIALLTGLNRRDVARVQAFAANLEFGELYNPIYKIVSMWIRDGAYLDKEGEPLPISISGEAPSLDHLRQRCCADVSMSAVVRELMLSGVASYADAEKTRLQLSQTGYIPKTDELAKLEIMGTDVSALIDTIDGNIEFPDATLFQRKVCVEGLSDEAVAMLNALACRDGQKWLEQLDEQLEQQSSTQADNIAGLGIYVFSRRRPSSASLASARGQTSAKSPAD